MTKTKPKRIQRKRTKGWKMPPNTLYVGRPSKWGNPFKVGELTNAQAVGFYEQMLGDGLLVDVNELKGKNLACWCPLEEKCHADILLKLANE